MTRHVATFEVDSRTDAHAVQRILERVYDSVREESRSVRSGTEDASEVLEAFESLRNAAQASGAEAGTLTITYETHES